MKDYCKYVNVFQGSGVIDLPKPEGIAATWYFRKAQCGNTTPAACLPFGKLSCGAYSGGYPTGYGTHNPNSCGSVTHFIEKKSVRGIAHMSQSGTGAIGFYYNYALTTPFYGELKDSSVLHEIEKESAAPGYYYVDIGGISAEATVTENTALHRYLFPKNGGRIAIDLSNDGLSEALGEGLSGVVENAEIKLISENEVLMSGFFRKIKLYFCIRVSGAKGSKLWDDYSETDSKSRSIEGARGKKYGAVFEIEGDRAEVRLALSTHSFEAAQAYLDAENVDFDTAKELAYKKWNDALSKIEIECGEREKEIFYSNLYHSLVKPSIWTGETVCGVPENKNEPLCIDYSTLWDIYKTQLPLIFTLFDEESRHIAGGLKAVAKKFGHIPVCFALMDDKNVETQQARMLGDLVLYDAYRRGIAGIDADDILTNTKNELALKMFSDYEREGRCPRATHTLDMADACAMAAELAREKGNTDFAERLEKLTENYKNVCDFETGLLTDASPYYEGDKWNYSFRLSRYFDERTELSGGKNKIIKLLDSFFGYGEEPVIQPIEPNCGNFIEETAPHRFEGYNNEPDMETPFAYIFCGEHKKTCEIIDAGIKYMFTTGDGGLPGNNDSGGLSSCYIWNMLGIYPVSGQDVMFLGSPHVENAVLHLAGGRKLEINVKNLAPDHIYVREAYLNGRRIEDYRFTVTEMMKGGTLEFIME
ncbi:MAG: glycoside hydrolase family 92 protein [Clostridia bacterium]|nr:glycoside hydrolase family 92 protein [Clostridia bacterium]